MSALLDIRDLSASYGAVRVLHGVDLSVAPGAITLLLGANGAGKTTTLRAISGIVKSTGSIKFDGKEILGRAPAAIARDGIAHVPQGRGTFAELSVHENLQAGAIFRKDRAAAAKEIDHWFERFPVLGKRRSQSAGLLSGGEQQMLAIARAMLSAPKLLMLDEPSLGLAPKIVGEILQFFGEINKESGMAILVVEQNAELALEFAHHGFVLEVGRTALSGTAEELSGNPAVQQAYLGGEISR